MLAFFYSFTHHAIGLLDLIDHPEVSEKGFERGGVDEGKLADEILDGLEAALRRRRRLTHQRHPRIVQTRQQKGIGQLA